MFETPKTPVAESSESQNQNTVPQTSQKSPKTKYFAAKEGQENRTLITSLPSFSLQQMSAKVGAPPKNNPFRGLLSGIDGPSAELQSENWMTNPHKNGSFYLEMKPANMLNFALADLTDLKLNPRGIGRIDVDFNGMEMTVQEPRIVCILRLNAAGVNRLHCKESQKNKMVESTDIFEKLGAAADADVVTIYHVLGSNVLSFKFGREIAEAKAFSVQLHEAIPFSQKSPIIEYNCEAVILSEHLREMYPLLAYGGKPHEVLVLIKPESASFTIGEKQWPYKYDEKNDGTTGLESGEILREINEAGFWIHYPDALRKVSYLSAGLLFCPATVNGTKITVQDHRVVCFPRLNATGVNTFHCNESSESLRVKLAAGSNDPTFNYGKGDASSIVLLIRRGVRATIVSIPRITLARFSDFLVRLESERILFEVLTEGVLSSDWNLELPFAMYDFHCFSGTMEIDLQDTELFRLLVTHVIATRVDSRIF